MQLTVFLSGATAFGFCACSLHFLHFWRQARDPLFLAFALAFALLGASQAVLGLNRVASEAGTTVFVVRLAAFLLILMAIAHKNRGRHRS